MGFRLDDAAVVSVAFIFSRSNRSNLFRRAILSRRMAAIENWQFKHGHARRAWLDNSGHLYFMEAAAIITLISLGHFFEARVSEKASGALKSLMELAPQTARRI